MTRAIRVAAALIAVCAFLAAPAVAPAQPEVSARAWVLVDAGDGAVLASRAAEQAAPVASATKLMTAYVARQDLRLGQTVAAPAYAAAPPETVLELREGERIRVRDLLAGLLLASGNDAAVALAEASAGSVPAFVDEMNAAAMGLGLEETSYANPIGLDEPGNHSSPADLASLAIELRRDPFLRRLVDRPRALLRSGDREWPIANRNELVRTVPWVNGVKTGHTLGAGHVLVGSGTRKGVTLVSVVLGTSSEDARDAATVELLRYGFSHYRVRAPVRRSQRLAAPPIRYRDQALPLVAARTLRIAVREGQEVDTEVVAPLEVEGPIERGERLGRVVVSVDGRSAGAVPLLAQRGALPPSPVERLDAAVPGPRAVLWAIAPLAIALGLGAILVVARRRRARRGG
jgi:D-alanyl-D-alanine carboxypeptidase (penicillin-binding protein 5/6)